MRIPMTKQTLIVRAVAAASLVCALGISRPAFSQEEGAGAAQLAAVHTGIPHDAVYDMSLTGANGIAVGGFGTILETKDSGASWNKVESGTEFALLGIAVNGEKRIVVGQRGTVLVGKPGGGWENIKSGSEARLMKVAVNAAGTAIAVGEFGTVLRSKDAGKTWSKQTLPWATFREDGYEPHLYTIAIDDSGRAVIGGEFSYVIVSTDSGENWKLVMKGDKSIFSMFFLPDGSGYAVGQEGLVMHTTDMGGTWTNVDTKSNANLFGVWCSKHGEIVVTGQRALLRSSDNGVTWTPSTDLEIARNWFVPIAAGEATTKSPGGEMVSQVIYIGGYMGKIARLLQ